MIGCDSGDKKGHDWIKDCSVLAEIGTVQIEFAYLSKLTGDPKYDKAVHDEADDNTLSHPFLTTHTTTGAQGV